MSSKQEYQRIWQHGKTSLALSEFRHFVLRWRLCFFPEKFWISGRPSGFESGSDCSSCLIGNVCWGIKSGWRGEQGMNGAAPGLREEKDICELRFGKGWLCFFLGMPSKWWFWNCECVNDIYWPSPTTRMLKAPPVNLVYLHQLARWMPGLA